MKNFKPEEGNIRFLDEVRTFFHTQAKASTLLPELSVLTLPLPTPVKRVPLNVLLIKAVDCLEIIMKSLRVDDSEAYLVRHMKVTPEQAHDILEMRVRQLKSLEKRKLLEERKACMTTLKTLRIDLKYPAKAAIRETVEAVDAIKKSGFL